jgi:hypothetical protein
MGGFGVDAGIVESITWHPVRVACYALWIGSLIWFAARVIPARLLR